MSPDKLPWTLVVAVAENGVIGRGDELPWRLRSDLRRFKQLTMGQCLLMGRKTFQSIGKPLPGRQTIVLSRSSFATGFPEVPVASSLDEVDALVEPARQVMVVGGAEIYRQAEPRCGKIWLTRVQSEVEGNVLFPTIDWSEWELVSTESLPVAEHDEYSTEFQTWLRK